MAQNSILWNKKVWKIARVNLFQVCLRKIARLIELEEYSFLVRTKKTFIQVQRYGCLQSRCTQKETETERKNKRDGKKSNAKRKG